MLGNDMFEMYCTNCKELIQSHRLGEVNVVECPVCKEIVPVKNATLTKEKDRNIIRSLKGLLHSAKINLNQKNKNPDYREKHFSGDRLSKKLIRDDFRLKTNDGLYGQLNFDDNKRLTRILNISYAGAGIEFTERGELPKNHSDTQLQLLLPGFEDVLSLPARIVWTRNPGADTINPSITMGLQFKDLDSNTHKSLCTYIWGNNEELAGSVRS